MTMTNVTAISSRAAKVATKAPPKPRSRRLATTRSPAAPRTQRLCAAAVLAVALVLTCLSLTHLAEGTRLVTGCDAPSAFAMAVGIDLSFIVIEISILNAANRTRQDVARFAVPAIIGTLILSAAMNALSFSEHSQGLMIYPAICLGLAIPALIYCLTRTGAALLRIEK